MADRGLKKSGQQNRLAALAACLVLILTSMSTGCSRGGRAPVFDGMTLTYAHNDSTTTVRFSKVDDGHFAASLSFDGEESQNRGVIVDKRMKRENGGVYEAGSLGPLWVPPASLKPGGRAHGDTVDEVTHWKNWEVGVIRASIGGGAIKGVWYYDVKTGFLVGVVHFSVMDDTDEGSAYVLSDTNLDELRP